MFATHLTVTFYQILKRDEIFKTKIMFNYEITFHHLSILTDVALESGSATSHMQ
jgi:hypothetical protein